MGKKFKPFVINKNVPLTLRKLIRLTAKAASKDPEHWVQITTQAVMTAKAFWNITDTETVNKIAGAAYSSAFDALTSEGKTPDDFIPKPVIEAPKFKPVKIVDAKLLDNSDAKPLEVGTAKDS